VNTGEVCDGCKRLWTENPIHVPGGSLN
jgi:hypothetical protein